MSAGGIPALKPGMKLGPYEIVAPLGAGGMGEVYRARDPRLGREVAVKVLPRAFASDPERQKRFEAEARAAGALNHPNIVTLHDVGASDGVPYIVTEVLEGEPLRALLSRGPLPPSRVAALLGQVALGLAAAHAKGIVHRDLKPENLFVLSDGRVKILDFGIAKLVGADVSASAETTPVFASMTAAGTVLGTVSYMAPEQLRDQHVDHRADLFALGAILYEAVAGRLAFPADTAADRVSAILTADPVPLAPSIEAGMPGLGELIRRCLEKRPETRFESARDFAYALDILASAARSRSNSSQATSVPAPAMPSVSIRQLTFREGAVSAARFAPDGVTVVYRAAWEGEPPQIYLSRTDNPDYQPLRLGNSQLLAVSSTAELAIGLDPRDMGGFVHLHTLARVSMLGGVPRELAKNVFAADWGPGGRAMAAIREVDGRFRIEYPLGTVLHEVSGWLSQIRVSADGKHLAFFEHPFGGNNAGDLRVMDASGGPPRTLVRAMESALTLAWHPSGKEIWFAASFVGEGAGLVYAVTLDGQMRVVYQTLGWPELHDFSSEGEALLLRSKPRLRLQTGTRSGGDSSRQELSWLDWSLLRDMTPDGTTVLFDETGPGVMHGASVYCRRTDGSPAVRIADGIAMGFLPDGKHVLALGGTAADRTFTVCPLGAGDARRIDTGELFCHFARPHPDGRTAIVLGNHSGEPVGLYRMSLETGAYERMTNEAVTITSPIVLPNGDVITRLANGTFAVVPASGGPTRPIAGLAGDERPAVSGQGDTQIFTFRRGQIPCPVARVDLETGRREAWLEIEPMTRSGTESFVSVAMTPDGERYTGAFTQQVADLFVVTGLV